MASGNMGDLWFNLGIKDNVSKDLLKVLRIIQESEGSVSKLRDKIQQAVAAMNEETGNKFSSSLKKNIADGMEYALMLQKVKQKISEIQELKKLNVGVDTSPLTTALGMLSTFKRDLLDLTEKVKKYGDFGEGGMQQYAGTFRNILSQVENLKSAFGKDNSLSSLTNSSARLNNELERVKNKLAEIRSLQSEGMRGGYKTGTLLGAGNILRGVQGRINKMLGDDNLLGNEAKYKTLLSDISRAFTRVTGKIQEYSREKRRTTEVNKADALAQRNSAMSAQQAYNQEIAYSKANSKAFAEQLKRQMEAREELRRQQAIQANMASASQRFRAAYDQAYHTPSKPYTPFTGSTDQFKEMQKAYGNAFDAIAKKYEELQDRISRFHGPSDNEWLVKAKTQMAEYENQMQRLVAASERLSAAQAQQMNSTYKPYTTSAKEDEQAILQRSQSLKNSILERMDAEKKAAAAEKKAAEDAKKNEAQRQAELEKTLTRIQALKQALHNLWGKRQESRSLGIDTSKADAQIKQTIADLRLLERIRENLAFKRGWEGFSTVGNLGNGREVSAINQLASEQAKLNAEKRESIKQEERHRQEVAATAAKVRGDLVSAFEQARKAASGVNSTVQDLKNLFLQGGIVYGVKQFAESIIQTGGEIVQQHIALRSILGDIAKADELFEQTKQLALQSPFKFGELNRDVKQLAAFGVEADELYDTTKRLADIASGLGVSFERLGLAYGQVKSRSWLDGKELRQFAYAGLPLLKSITEMYNQTGRDGRTDFTESDVKKMISNREVSFEDVQKVLWNMTDEGGKFYNMQFVLSNTLLGQWNKLIDAWDIMLGKFAEGNNVIGGTFTFIIKRVTDLLMVLDKLSPALLAFGAAFALKKGFGAIAARTGITQELAAMKAAQATQLRIYAVEQQRLLVEGKITQEEMRRNIVARQGFLNSKMNIRNSYEELALKGKLSQLQMQRLVQEKLISPELIKQLELMGMISARQSELIMKGGFWNRTLLMGNQALSKISGMFTGGNLASMGIAVGAALWMGYEQYESKLQQSLDNLKQSLSDHLKSLNDSVTSALNIEDNPESKLAEIEKMKDTLTQTGYWNDDLNAELEALDDINKQYDLLVQKTKDAAENTKLQSQYTDLAAGAIKESYRGDEKTLTWRDMFGDFGLKPWAAIGNMTDSLGWTENGGIAGWIGGLFNDDLEKNAKDLEEFTNRVSVALSVLSEDAKLKLETTANSFLSPQEQALSLEQKLAILKDRGGDDWDSLVATVSGGDKKIKKTLDNIGDAADDMADGLDEIAKDDIPKIFAYLAKKMGMSESEFKKYCQNNPKQFQGMMDSILSIANITAPKVRDALKSMFFTEAGIKDDKEKGKGGKNTSGWVNPLKQGTIGRKLWDKLLNAGKIEGQKGDMANLLLGIDQGKSKGWHEFGEALRNKYKDWAYEDNSSKKAGETQKYYYKRKMLEKAAAQIGVSLEMPKDKTTGDFGKGDKGSKEDKELSRLKEKVSLYKTYYTELRKYRKLYGKDADKMLEEDKNFAPIKAYGLKDASDYGGSIRQLTGSIKQTTTDRKAFVQKSIADISTKDREEEQERISDVNSELSKKLNLLGEEYDLYKKLYELTGDREGSMMIAFQGNTVQSETMLDDLFRRTQEELNRTHPGAKAEDVLSLPEADFNKMFGEKSEKLSVLYDAYNKEQDKVKKETINKMYDLIKNNRTLDQQIEDLDREHDLNISRIWGSSTTTEMKKRAADGEDKEYKDKKSKLLFERFKKDSDWVTVFDDLSRVSSSTIDTMITDIDKFSKDTSLSVEEVKQLRDALAKLRAEQVERNPFGTMFTTIGEGNAIGKFIKDNKPVNGKYTVGKDDAKKMGIAEGEYSKAGLEGLQSGKYSNFTKSLQGVANKFKALNDVMSPVINLLSAYGKENTIAEGIMKGGNDAFGAAIGTAGAFNTLSNMKGFGDGAQKVLANAGPYAAAASAAISIIGSFAAAHDAALQREIEASQRRQKEMDNLSKNIQSVIESTLGGIYNFKISETDKKYLYDQKSKYSERTQKQIDKGQKSNSAFDNQYAALMAQRDEVNKQMNAESKKKKSDSSAISDYKQQLRELDLQIETFIDDWAKSIYDIDLKDWASQLTDAIVEAWSKGEDAVDAYKDKVHELIKSLTKNIISQSVLEIALEPVQKSIRDMMTEHDGKLTADDAYKLAQELYTAVGNSVDNVTNILDALKDRGLDLSENGTLSTSNSIKSVTEETADLLASYINAIRLDVSVNRDNILQILNAVQDMPKLNVIAQSQLTQLNTLVKLAETRNSTLEEMYDWMRSLTNGTKKISVA